MDYLKKFNCVKYVIQLKFIKSQLETKSQKESIIIIDIVFFTSRLRNLVYAHFTYFYLLISSSFPRATCALLDSRQTFASVESILELRNYLAATIMTRVTHTDKYVLLYLCSYILAIILGVFPPFSYSISSFLFLVYRFCICFFP